MDVSLFSSGAFANRTPDKNAGWDVLPELERILATQIRFRLRFRLRSVGFRRRSSSSWREIELENFENYNGIWLSGAARGRQHSQTGCRAPE